MSSEQFTVSTVVDLRRALGLAVEDVAEGLAVAQSLRSPAKALDALQRASATLARHERVIREQWEGHLHTRGANTAGTASSARSGVWRRRWLS